jgi:beta-glucosidase-like glycosyl hydrolase
MGMAGVTQLYKPGEAAVRAIKAGNDVILHSPDDGAAFAAIKAAVQSGDIPQAQIDKSVERVLRAKAFAGLHRSRSVNLDALANIVGGPRSSGGGGRRQPEVAHADSRPAEPDSAQSSRPTHRSSTCHPRLADGAGGLPRRAARSFPSCGAAGAT